MSHTDDRPISTQHSYDPAIGPPRDTSSGGGGGGGSGGGVTLLLVMCLLGLVVFVGAELPASVAAVALLGEAMGVLDQVLLGGALVARFLLLGCVLGLVVWGARRLGFERSGVVFCLGASAMVTLLVALQAAVLQATGNGLWYYVSKLQSPQAVQWVGGWSAVVLPVLGLLLGAMGVTAGLWWAVGRLLRDRLKGAGSQRRMWASAVVVLLIGVVGQFAAVRPDLVSVPRSSLLWAVTLADQPYRYPESSREFQRMVEPALASAGALLGGPKVERQPAGVLSDRPVDVVVLVCESFRASAFSEATMPMLWRRVQQRGGWVGLRHYAGSNCSELGLFAMVTGSAAIDYRRRLDAGVEPALPARFREAGYDTLFTTSGHYRGFERMDEFLDPPAFDEAQPFPSSGSADWSGNDRRVLALLRERLAEPMQRRPLLALAYLMVTHYPYEPPADAPQCAPPSAGGITTRGNEDISVVARLLSKSEMDYNRCVLWLDRELDAMLASIDLTRTIVVLTGDHGESFGEDGVLGHASRASDAQLQTPLVVLVPDETQRREFGDATHHPDLLSLLSRAAGIDTGQRPTPGSVFAWWSNQAGDRMVLLTPRTIGPVPGLPSMTPVLLALEGEHRALLPWLVGPDAGVDRAGVSVLHWLGEASPQGHIERARSPLPMQAARWSELLLRAASDARVR